MSNFKSIKEEISRYNANFASEIIYNRKLNKNFLLVFISGSKNKLVVYDEEHGTNEIARILYVISGKNLVVSELEVQEEFQQNGIAKLLFNIALAQADLQGATFAYGQIDPINNIKGVEPDNQVALKEKLIEIYAKLGCIYNKENNNFEMTWNENEKLSGLDRQIKSFVYDITNNFLEIRKS